MADTPNISTARATFIAALLPSDRHAPSLTQQSALKLVRQLNRTVNVCTSSNIQQCTKCIITYILPSPARTAALFRYLLVLSKSCQPRPADSRITERTPALDDGLDFQGGQLIPPKSAFRRLHLVYIIHDVLITAHAWRAPEQVPRNVRHLDLPATSARLKTQMIGLLRLAACRGEHSEDGVSQPLLNLIAQWRALRILQDEEAKAVESIANSCHERAWEQVLEESALEDDQRAAEERKAREEAYKWVLPRRHGVKDDPDAPWYELPAANGLYMKSLRGFPLRAGAFPRGGFELKYGGQEADSDLQKDVSWLHTEMLHCFESYTDPEEIQDVDALGNRVWKDPERPTRNYWGFTYDGIDKAKENGRKFRERATGYRDVAPLLPEPGSMDQIDNAVARARALAGGRGGFDNRGGRSRGGYGGGGAWRGPPRGGNGFRGGRGGGPPGRYY